MSQHAERSWPRAVTALAAGAILLSACSGHSSTATLRTSPHATPKSSTSTASTTTSTAPTTTSTTVDPGSLPQTTAMPSTADPDFAAGEAALWSAIVHDDPKRAMPFFFPLSAYLQVKAISDPAEDWHERLVAAYWSDIHELHTELGSAVASAKFLGLEVPDAAEWMVPGSEYNKLGYWRVLGDTLRYEVGGTVHSFPIYSLISWRGRWYVVHISPP